ncbi:MAG: type II secretion system minor pseudopilin GspJ [Pseudomonadota bacterium]|nr:type II secretion system minor pseudopilin GspJ [Pseudomonadota bacterium]
MRRPAVGFTLVEILVAVAIFSVIAAISFGALDGYLKARDKVAGKYASLQQLQRMFTLLERDFRFAVDRPVRDGNGELQPIVGSGGGQEAGELIRFTMSVPAPLKPGMSNLQRVSWGLREGDLYRSTWQVLDRVQDSEQVAVRVAEKIESVELVFFLWDDDSGLRQVAEWTKQDQLPAGVELLITLDDEKPYRRIFDMPNGG